MSAVASAGAQAAMESGLARKPILDLDAYRRSLRARLDPTAAGLELIFDKVRAQPKRIVFAEGEEEKTIRAALLYAESGYGGAGLIAPQGPVRRNVGAAPPPP